MDEAREREFKLLEAIKRDIDPDTWTITIKLAWDEDAQLFGFVEDDDGWMRMYWQAEEGGEIGKVMLDGWARAALAEFIGNKNPSYREAREESRQRSEKARRARELAIKEQENGM